MQQRLPSGTSISTELPSISLSKLLCHVLYEEASSSNDVAENVFFAVPFIVKCLNASFSTDVLIFETSSPASAFNPVLAKRYSRVASKLALCEE